MSTLATSDLLWTPLAREIVFTLTNKVSCFTQHQLARTWWSDRTLRTAERHLTLMVQGGYLTRLRRNVHPELTLQSPVQTWRPGDPPPAFGALGYALQSRWTEPLRPVVLYVPTRKATAHFGGPPRFHPRPHQFTHDLHLSQIYLHIRASSPEQTAAWVPENRLPSTPDGEKRPDAVLHDAQGDPILVIEFGGAYSAERVEDFHRHCEQRALAYQLW